MKALNRKETKQVLTGWTALEILSPTPFKSEERAAHDSGSVVFFKDHGLPWQGGGEKVKANKKLFYQVVIGSIDTKKAIDALMEKYEDSRVEKPVASGKAIIGVVVVDQHGCLIKEGAVVAISSFAWGLPQALEGKLCHLGNWSLIEKEIENKFVEILSRKDKAGNHLPLDQQLLKRAYHYLVETFNIPSAMVINEQFAIRNFRESTTKEPLQPLLLNSFYLNDLATAKQLLHDGQAPESLLYYLGAKIRTERHSVLQNAQLIESIVAPENMPLARWPGYGRYPLVLLQQAAVNAAMMALKEPGIFAVNGPPGTGKTTLLRDIIASIVTDRAQSLLEFDDPEQAFTQSAYTIKSGQSSLYLHQLDEKLKGFEIMIASSNNKAVQNISAELPNLNAIASDALDLRYFSTISDQLLNCKTWGIISAVLGNSANRSRFSQTFWGDKDHGFATYLQAITGQSREATIKDGITGKREPKIILENDPPANHIDALKRWQQARSDFEQVLKKCQTRLAELQEARMIVHELDILESALANGQTFEDLLLQHQQLKPNCIIRVLSIFLGYTWQAEGERLSRWGNLIKQRAVFFDTLKRYLIDHQFFAKDNKEINQIAPWCDSETHALRDQLFIQSIKLHKAFIDAAAKPLLHNLGVLMQTFSNQHMITSEQILDLMPDLWSSFFLVVPSISTTFASVKRFLGYLPANALGWLLIDEAGQALPQAAVGAIMRSKRVVVTGDPMQIEPIVELPDQLTKKICEQFGIDPDRFNAPAASVQTLADENNCYFAEFHSRYGSRSVGFPLLVHRRCVEPMFTVANAIAYQHLMISAKSQSHSLVRTCLGASTWFDIQSPAQDKWSAAEGEKVLELLYQLKDAEIFPDLYIVTPFRVVAGNVRRVIRRNAVLKQWLIDIDRNWLSDRIGTVHTVQGREAEAVILVLGAPAVQQNGARAWAGRTPNLLNVAVTRAKEALYVVGNRSLWKEAGVFKTLHDEMENGQC